MELSKSQFPVLDKKDGNCIGEIPTELIKRLFKEYGAVLLRDLSASKEDFLTFTKQLAPGIERDVVKTETSLEFHGELYYMSSPPDILWFYCIQPAPLGGQTLLCDGVQIAVNLRPSTRRFFDESPLVYEHSFSRDVWLPRFKTENKSEVVETPRRQSVAAEFYGDILHTRFETFAIRPTKWGGQPAFINSLLHALDSRRRKDLGDYGLEMDITEPAVAEISALTDMLAYPIEWHCGDIAMIDNTRVMHARRTFSGGRRIIAVNGSATF